ncbi:MAG: EpsI family protein, partial [Gammaproteobacteria bacterium]|nr:EpsI family protein [Gammaproteobacteria bacterium]
HYPGASGEALVAYNLSGVEIDVYANWYVNQAQGRELIGSGNNIAGQSMWRKASTDRASIMLENGEQVAMRELVLESRRQDKRLLWYTYETGSRSLVSPVNVKLWQGWQSRWGAGKAGLLAVSMACESDCANERRILKDHAGSIYKPVNVGLREL